MEQIYYLVLDRIQKMVEQAALAETRGESSTSEFLLAEAKSLASVMDGTDGSTQQLFTMKYHRYCSESFGVVFEIEHGDPELMFGGVV